MDENQSIFRGIVLGKNVSQSVALADQGHDIPVFNHCNVLGATLHHKLIFDMHAGTVCLFVSRQINTGNISSRFPDEGSRVW